MSEIVPTTAGKTESADPARHFDAFYAAQRRALKKGPTRQTRHRAETAIRLLLEGNRERLSCSREYDNCLEMATEIGSSF
jgi:rRNA maturation protein Nop10